MIDENVAALFQVSLQVFRQRVGRNKLRFPPISCFHRPQKNGRNYSARRAFHTKLVVLR